jgi:hypothetical protein
MKKAIAWFIVGFVASWLTWSVVSYVRLRPRDLTHTWPSDVQKIYGGYLPWLRSAVARKVGSFVVCASGESSNASVAITPHGASFPQVFMSDDNLDGHVDSIILSGAGFQSVTVDDLDGDGDFDKHSVSTGDLFATNTICLIDGNMDGYHDLRIGPGRRVDVCIDSTWYRRTTTNGQHFVDANGVRTEVVLTNGIWKVKN